MIDTNDKTNASKLDQKDNIKDKELNKLESFIDCMSNLKRQKRDIVKHVEDKAEKTEKADEQNIGHEGGAKGEAN